MIAKMRKCTGSRRPIAYDIGKSGARVIDTNMSGESPGELAREFDEVRKLRPGLKKYIAHPSISAAPGEHLTDEQWREKGRKYLEDMGFSLTKNQYVITRHTDTDLDHLHITVNRISIDGSVVSDSHDYRRQEAIMREIEVEFGLKRVEPSSNAARKAPTRGEIERAARTGEPSTRAKLQQIVGEAAAQGGTFTQFHERLSAAGVEIVPVAQQGGERIAGLSYRLDGTVMKGSDLGRGFTAAGVQKGGVSYAQDRDFAAVRCCLDREAARRVAPGGSSPAVGRRYGGQPVQATRGTEVRPGRPAAGRPGGPQATGVPALSAGGNVRAKPVRKNSVNRKPQNPLAALRQRPSRAFLSLLLSPVRLAISVGRRRQAEAARAQAEEQRRQRAREKLRRTDPLSPPPARCEHEALESWVWKHREAGVGERDLFKSATRIGHDDELVLDVLAKDDVLRRRATRAQAERERRQPLPVPREANVREPAQAPHTRVKNKHRPRRPSRGPELGS